MWKQVLTKDFISSEESGEEVLDNGRKQPVLKVKFLPWRATRVNKVFKRFDEKAMKVQTKQSLQQTLPRVCGHSSTRPKPLGFSDDFWGFTAD